MINDHAGDCPCYSRINGTWPTVKMKPDMEAGTAGELVKRREFLSDYVGNRD